MNVGVWAIAIFALAIIVLFAIFRGMQDTTWHASRNGNQTIKVGSLRLTVFEQDRGWKYCISQGSGDDNPYFSERYATEQEAKEAATAHANGQESPHKTSREAREDANLNYHLSITKDANEIYHSCHSSISEMYSSGRINLTALRPIKKKLDRTERSIIEAYKHNYAERREADANALWKLREDFNELESFVDTLIAWIESGAKKAKECPPQLIPSARVPAPQSMSDSTSG